MLVNIYINLSQLQSANKLLAFLGLIYLAEVEKSQNSKKEAFSVLWFTSNYLNIFPLQPPLNGL